MKIFNRPLLLLLSGLLLLASCKDRFHDKLPQQGEEDKLDTYVRIKLSLPQQPPLRAVNDSQEDFRGDFPLNMDLLSSVENKHWLIGTVEQGFEFFWVDSSASDFTVFPFRTKAGKQKMAVVLDQDPQSTDKLSRPSEEAVYDASADLKAGLTKFYAPATSRVIATSEVSTKEVSPGISRTQALRERALPPDDAKNIFGFSCEPVLAKGLLLFKSEEARESDSPYDSGEGPLMLTEDGRAIVLVNLYEDENTTHFPGRAKDKRKPQFAALNSAVKTYIFRNHAGQRKMDENSQQYPDYKSAIDGELLNFKAAKDPNAVRKTLLRLGNIDKTSNAALGEYRARKVLSEKQYDKIKQEKNSSWIYFYENSVSSLGDAANKDYGFYRLAYAKLYVTVRPTVILSWNEEKGVFVDIANKDFNPEGVGAVGLPIAFDDDDELTFYRGAEDDLFYATVADAQKAVPGQKVYTYKNGRCFYRVLWNRQITEATSGVETVINANTRRNNAYLLIVEGFNKIGSPWDSSDPDDPNLPKPQTPEEGDTPDDPDIEKQSSYLKVATRILPWQAYKRTVTID